MPGWKLRLQNLETTCEEQLKMRLEEVEASTDSESVENCDEILQRYSELLENLESFGPVNMTALEEYEENEERYNFLTTQKNDIEKSIVDTKQAMQEINTRSRIQFSKAFKEINKNFNTVFRKLFGGGECGMELMDDEDILDCGIDVIAQPPGKKTAKYPASFRRRKSPDCFCPPGRNIHVPSQPFLHSG